MQKKLLEYIAAARTFLAVQLMSTMGTAFDPIRGGIVMMLHMQKMNTRLDELRNLIEQCNEGALERLFGWLKDLDNDPSTGYRITGSLFEGDANATAFVTKWNELVGTWYPLSLEKAPVFPTEGMAFPLTGAEPGSDAALMYELMSLSSSVRVAQGDIEDMADAVSGILCRASPDFRERAAKGFQKLSTDLKSSLAVPADAIPTPAITAPVLTPVDAAPAPEVPLANPADVADVPVADAAAPVISL
jgi:hypothetical protein